MSEVSRLLLVRHAQPEEEARGRCYGTLDVGLSVRGQRKAQLLARTLDRVPLAAIYTSPRRRAVGTAGPLASVQGLTPIVDEALREIDFGDFEGRSYEEIERSHPELYRRWMETPTLVRFPGGENYERLRVRALAAMEAIRARHPGETAMVVSHGGVLRAMLADCLSMPSEAIFRLDQAYGAISIVDWVDSVPLVRLLNAQPTMAAAKRRGFLPGVGGAEAAARMTP
jgi:alpha-ribazole phosphatase